MPRSSSSSHEDFQILNSCPQDPPSPSSFEFVTMLPTVIQTRLSIVPSLRRTLSDYGLRARARENPTTDMIVHRRSESTELVLSQKTPSDDLSIELKSKLSLHGYNLLQASLAESQASNPESRAFSRQLYLDSVSYLLQGLPSDLSDREAVHIHKAIPAEIQAANESNFGSGYDSFRRRHRSGKPPSILHRSLASTIVMVCVVLRLFLPYLKYLAQAAYKYDREYHVSEKIFATGMQATDTLGRRAFGIASTALGSEVVMETVGYCVDGVCGGVTEGLGEGMKAIESRDRY